MRLLVMALAMAGGVVISSCSIYRNDKMWIPEEKYAVARKVYDETGSLALTEQTLRESRNWRKAEMGEAMYRLKKQYGLE